MKFNLYREFFRALANRTRFSIVQLLRSRPHHVGQIGKKLGIEQSRVSHNLACLLNCGFVLAEWQGKNKVYRLNPDMLQILAGIEKHLVRYAPALDRCAVLQAEAKPLLVTPAAHSRKVHRAAKTEIEKGKARMVSKVTLYSQPG